MDQAIGYLMTALQIIESRRQLGFPFAREIAEYYNTLARYFAGDLVITDEMWDAQAARKAEALAAWANAKPGDIPPIG